MFVNNNPARRSPMSSGIKVQQLQETVDTLRSDLDRLQESQDFTTRLLSERSSKRE